MKLLLIVIMEGDNDLSDKDMKYKSKSQNVSDTLSHHEHN